MLARETNADDRTSSIYYDCVDHSGALMFVLVSF